VAGTSLAIGSHQVTLTVSDGSCSDSETILVEVITAGQATELCVALVENSAWDRPEKRSLVQVLKQAAKKFDRGQTGEGARALETFIKKVNNPAFSRKVPPEDAAAYVACAQDILDALE